MAVQRIDPFTQVRYCICTMKLEAFSPENEAPDAGDSKIQLILAGERLFAERGVDGASLREIASLAGHGNNNAVRYHFGSKQGLVQAIFRYRVAMMEPIRARYLAELEERGLLGDARSLIEVIMLPYFLLRAPDGTISYPGFMMQYLLKHRPRGMEHASEIGDDAPALKRINGLLKERIAHLDPVTVERRILSAMILFIGAVISAENNDPPLGPDEYRDLIDDTIDQCVAALLLPDRRRQAGLMADPQFFGGI